MRKIACQEISTYLKILGDMILFCTERLEAYLEPSRTSMVELFCESY